MTCRRCSAKMHHTSLKYEGRQIGDFTASADVHYYKCPICAHQQYPPGGDRKKKLFIKGQRVKGVLGDSRLDDS